MKKFECKDCGANCRVTVKHGDITPCYCPYDKERADWHEVKEVSAENEQFGNSEQLPDWVKVGASVYNIEKKQYQTISLINGTVTCKNIDSEGCTQYGYGAFMSDCVEARKRPFNEAEMKALVGKLLKHNTGIYLVTAFENRWNQVKIESVWRDSEELKELWTQLDGKPCYKLEHLNEKGEWVE